MKNQAATLPSKASAIRQIGNYIEVLKPLPSILLAFIGVCAAIIAGEGRLSPQLPLVLLTILVAAAGANGLTNYLDRDIDARMDRTCHRALPSRRIYPAARALPLIIGLIAAGLGLAWLLHPFAFWADLGGTAVAAAWRKKVTCVFPQGVIASCAPVLMGWFAVRPGLDWEILLLCVIIALWLPLHVWSLVAANREDYLRAGLKYFPIRVSIGRTARIVVVFSLVLYAAALALYFVGGFAWLYLLLANVLGIMMVYGGLRVVFSGAARDAWRLYRLSAFPYLGIMFLAICVDIWLLH